jgi:hypothetical protein
MNKILKSNVFLIALSTIVICFLISFLSNDIVLSDKVYQKYLDEKHEEKYNEYKDLDVDLSDFEDELKRFEQTTAEDSGYGWDEFYIDSIFVIVPLLLVAFGFSGTFLILILFNKKLHIIKYLDILKATLIAFIVFYLPEVISAVYFLIFKKNYELKDIHNFESYFGLSKFFNKDSMPQWLWDIVSQTGFVYLIFPLLVALLLGIMYKNFKTSALIGYSYLTYAIVFLLYNTVFWYLFDLV